MARRRSLLVVALLASPACAKKRQCDETVLNEALTSFDDPSCVADMKQCLAAGTCLAAGIDESRLCECYLQVRLPLPGRELSDYDCRPTTASYTLLKDWRRCKKQRKTEL